MLIGDKGQCGGRRWEVSGFALGAFSDSPKVHRLVVAGFGLGPFSASPKVSRWVLHFSQIGIFGVVPRPVAGLCIFPIRGFA